MNETLLNGIVWLIVWLVIGFIAFSIGTFIEKKNFNGGKCDKCNTDLRLFDIGSYGGRGYICDKCNKIVWVSYKHIDADYRKTMIERK